MIEYYSGQTLLSKMDINGNRPEVYLCTGNRTAGKTTYFNSFVLRKFIQLRQKFALLYRFQYELSNVSDKFFKDIGGLFFQDYRLKSFPRDNGSYCELYLYHGPHDPHGESCGYAITINGSDQVKKMSHMMTDTDWMFFDEFQSETNKYCPDELTKFKSIHTSLARGAGKQTRYLPVIMASNNVSLINPYFVDMGISDRIRKDTKFLRGPGYVLEVTFNESAARSQRESGFNQAFRDTRYVDFASQNVYLNDSMSFISQPSGRSRYLATLRCDGREFAVREFAELGIVYCDDHPDLSFPVRISVTTDDHQINYVMLRKHDLLVSNCRYLFERGCFRFKNLQCKNAIMKLVCY